MNLAYQFLIFILGLAALLWGAERLVDSAKDLAKKLGVNPLIIGLTVLSIGTSLPEIATSIASFVTGHADIAMGNIIGSELVQITLILGIVAMIRPVDAKRKELIFYGVSMIVAVLLALLVILDGTIVWYEGLLLSVSYGIFLYFVVKNDKYEKTVEVHTTNTKKMYFYIVLGTALTIVGAKLLVMSTVELSRFFGVSEYIISVYLVGFGTSLPELVVSGIAAYKKQFSMSVGNLLGSNITDPTLSFGIGALFVGSANIAGVAIQSIMYLLFVFVMVLGLFIWKKKMNRWGAIVLFALYAGSFWFL